MSALALCNLVDTLLSHPIQDYTVQLSQKDAIYRVCL
jgi:hypothetical protein